MELSLEQVGSSGQTQGSTSFQRFINEQIDPSTGQPYKGFWSYWNKPSNIRFYAIWLLGLAFVLFLFWLFTPSKPKYRPKTKKKAKKTTNNLQIKKYRRV